MLNTNSLAEYLTEIKDPKMKPTLTKYRMSDYNLEEETG